MVRVLSHRAALESPKLGIFVNWLTSRSVYLLESQGHASCVRIAELRTLRLEPGGLSSNSHFANRVSKALSGTGNGAALKS